MRPDPLTAHEYPLEHVLPQNPKADSLWLADLSEEQRGKLTPRLGNLVLLNHRKNSQANNGDFIERKRKYFTTAGGSAAFALTTQVIEHDVWTPPVVEARQQALTSLMEHEWKLN